MKVILKRLQIVNGVAYHAGEQDVPDNVAEILETRGAIAQSNDVARETKTVKPLAK